MKNNLCGLCSVTFGKFILKNKWVAERLWEVSSTWAGCNVTLSPQILLTLKGQRKELIKFSRESSSSVPASMNFEPTPV